jgi:FlaA1/EpsC-like NDP-sugar epimerase
LVICIFSIVYANYLRYNLLDGNFFQNSIIDDVVIATISNAIFFYLFKTYEGIIRFSGFQEAVRSFSAVFYSFFVLLMANVVIHFFGKQPFIQTPVLIIYFFVSSFLVFGYRLLVKNLYRISVTQEDSSNVVVYGGEMNGSLLKRTIEQASNHKYQVVAFIDDDERFIGKSIDNVKIYGFEQIMHVMQSWEIRMLFFAKQDFDLDLKNKIVDYCLEHNITIKNIPPIKEWIQGQLNLKQLRNVKIDDLLGRPPISFKNPSISSLFEGKTVERLIVCDQTETGLYDIEYELNQKFNLGKRLKVYIGDVRDEISMRNLFSKYQPHIVFHAAAYKHVPMMEHHPCEAIKNNVIGTKVMADLSLEFNAERFLLISTDKAINPTNVMGASKRISEVYVQSLGKKHDLHHLLNGNGNGNGHSKYHTKFITTRFGNVLGSNGSVIPRFKEQIDKGGPITVTHPDIIRYFMTIPEACGLVLEAVTMGNGGEIFLFDMGEPVKIIDLAKKMIKLAGMEPGKDINIEFTGLRPGEKLFEELLNKEEEVIPTHNKKILIAKVIEYDFDQINDSIGNLITIAINHKDEDVVRTMKKILPEFISNNSKFEMYDEELNADAAALV